MWLSVLLQLYGVAKMPAIIHGESSKSGQYAVTNQVTSHSQTSSKDILFSVGPSPFGRPSCLDLRPRALILTKTMALLTYLPITIDQSR